MSLVAHAKKVLCRFMVLSEFCDDCGRRVGQVWYVADDLWVRFGSWRHPYTTNGCLCIRCFDRHAKRAGVLLHWTAFGEGS